VSAGHDQTATILNRHGDVISRWNSLLGASNSRKQRLLRMQDQFRQIEELYLTFAKKASAFNSWFENAEEDLTDPVRCNSIEEIRALREAHAQFQVKIIGFNDILYICVTVISFDVLYIGFFVVSPS
jgi:spectrin alpha